MKLKSLISICFALLALSSCRRDPLAVDDLDLELSIPIAQTEMSLENFVEPENYKPGEDGAVDLVYELPIYSGSSADLLYMPVVNDRFSVSLQTVRLSNSSISTSVKLKEAYPAVALLDGRKVVVPPLSVNNASTVPIDANSFFKSAQIDSGGMYVTVHNGFPVEISYLKFRLSNQSDNSLVGEMEFYNIKPGETALDSADMAGIYAEGSMLGELLEVSTLSSDSEVVVNANAAVTLSVRVNELKASKATAVFPAQDLIHFDRLKHYQFDGGRFHEIGLKGGKLTMKVQSNIDETIYIRYEAPALTYQGDTVKQNFVVPPSTSANPYSEEKVVDLAGFNVNLRGKKSAGWTRYNSFHHRLIARIDSTGVLKTISNEDSVYLFIGISDLEASYALGFLGRRTIEIPTDKVKIDAFDNVFGEMELSGMEIGLSIKNDIGVDGVLNFNEVTAIGKNGQEVSLQSAILRQGIQVLDAPDKNTPWYSYTKLDENNASLLSFMKILPESIRYNLSFYMNPDYNNNNFGDFIYDKHRIEAGIEMKLPMNLKTSELILQDTVPVDFSGIENIDRVKAADLHIIAYNSFPMEGDFEMIFFDADGKVIDTLFKNSDPIKAGLRPDFSQKVQESAKSIISHSLDGDQLNRILEAKRALTRARFKTSSASYSRIYQDYRISLTFSGQFTYEQPVD